MRDNFFSNSGKKDNEQPSNNNTKKMRDDNIEKMEGDNIEKMEGDNIEKMEDDNIEKMEDDNTIYTLFGSISLNFFSNSGEKDNEQPSNNTKEMGDDNASYTPYGPSEKAAELYRKFLEASGQEVCRFNEKMEGKLITIQTRGGTLYRENPNPTKRLDVCDEFDKEALKVRKERMELYKKVSLAEKIKEVDFKLSALSDNLKNLTDEERDQWKEAFKALKARKAIFKKAQKHKEDELVRKHKEDELAQKYIKKDVDLDLSLTNVKGQFSEKNPESNRDLESNREQANCLNFLGSNSKKSSYSEKKISCQSLDLLHRSDSTKLKHQIDFRDSEHLDEMPISSSKIAHRYVIAKNEDLERELEMLRKEMAKDKKDKDAVNKKLYLTNTSNKKFLQSHLNQVDKHHNNKSVIKQVSEIYEASKGKVVKKVSDFLWKSEKDIISEKWNATAAYKILSEDAAQYATKYSKYTSLHKKQLAQFDEEVRKVLKYWKGLRDEQAQDGGIDELVRTKGYTLEDQHLDHPSMVQYVQSDTGPHISIQRAVENIVREYLSHTSQRYENNEIYSYQEYDVTRDDDRDAWFEHLTTRIMPDYQALQHMDLDLYSPSMILSEEFHSTDVNWQYVVSHSIDEFVGSMLAASIMALMSGMYNFGGFGGSNL